MTTTSLTEHTFRVGPENAPRPRELPQRWSLWLGTCFKCNATRWGETFNVQDDAWQIICLDCGHTRPWRKVPG